MRLQKYLSAAGLCSRREAEKWIESGRVAINGRVATLGESVGEGESVTVDGKTVSLPEEHTYVLLHKPRGYVTTLSDEKGRRTVADLVSGCGARVWPVGRLDMDSEGLLLLTDDGELTHRLLHPSHEIEKEYLVWVTGDVKRALPILSAPMELDGDRLAPAKVRRGKVSGGVSQLSIVIHQGKNRQVRRMCAQAGLTVLRLKRIREGGLSLDRSLPPGKWRPLTGQELLLLSREGKKED